MKKRHLIILCLSLIVLSMSTSCFRKEEKRIEAQWENALLLPGCAGMPENIGLAGAYSGIVEGKLLVLGGANFPDRYPWEGGTKTWWSALYSYDLDTKNWSVALLPQKRLPREQHHFPFSIHAQLLHQNLHVPVYL